MPETSGQFDDHFIDREIAKADLKKPVPRTEIADPQEIQIKIEKSKAIFWKFLHSKLASYVPKTPFGSPITFDVTFDNMLRILELTDIPRNIAINEMSKIVLSTPGIVQTPNGYYLKDPKLLIENYGPRTFENRILDFFLRDKRGPYKTTEISQALNLNNTAVYSALLRLRKEKKVILVGKEQRKTKGRKAVLWNIDNTGPH